jgi:Tfp pilus assembly protein PilF
MRLVLLSALALSTLGSAPMQCRRDPDPNLRIEDTAGDALWDLAADFKKKGNEQAARDTLRYLVEHYPSNRHAEAARAELGPSAGASDGGT